MAIQKRAYSDEEKRQREDMIINAAETLLMQKGYYDINMNEIARTANLAKGTVYLYFQTKEELFLTLFERYFGAWMENVEAQVKTLGDQTTKSDIVNILVDNTIKNRQLVRLAAMTSIIFEHNISYEKARDYKFWLYEQATHLGLVLEKALKLPPQSGNIILFRLYVFTIGLENIANPPPVVEELYQNEQQLRHPDFETELRALIMMVIDAF